MPWSIPSFLIGQPVVHPVSMVIPAVVAAHFSRDRCGVFIDGRVAEAHGAPSTRCRLAEVGRMRLSSRNEHRFTAHAQPVSVADYRTGAVGWD